MKDAIKAGLMWLDGYWEEDVRGSYTGPVHHLLSDKDFDLHFNLPGVVVGVGRAAGQ